MISQNVTVSRVKWTRFSCCPTLHCFLPARTSAASRSTRTATPRLGVYGCEKRKVDCDLEFQVRKFLTRPPHVLALEGVSLERSPAAKKPCRAAPAPSPRPQARWLPPGIPPILDDRRAAIPQGIEWRDQGARRSSLCAEGIGHRGGRSGRTLPMRAPAEYANLKKLERRSDLGWRIHGVALAEVVGDGPNAARVNFNHAVDLPVWEKDTM